MSTLTHATVALILEPENRAFLLQKNPGLLAQVIKDILDEDCVFGEQRCLLVELLAEAEKQIHGGPK